VKVSVFAGEPYPTVAPAGATEPAPSLGSTMIDGEGVRPVTVIVWPAAASVPPVEVEYPAAVAVVDGALQPVGTSIEIAPFDIPPVAAV
jgi:hypothetical protein